VSSRVAAEGVDAQAGAHFRVANSPDEYVSEIMRIINDPAERDRLARAGRARMLSHHSWPASMQRLDAIVERCMSLAASRKAA
jgi:polysaccharide biosynthesis protein PslH